MDFKKYQALARKVFPVLPREFDSMPDALSTYSYMVPYLVPADIHAFDDWTDWQKLDLFSLDNITMTQIRHLHELGRTVWDEQFHYHLSEV